MKTLRRYKIILFILFVTTSLCSKHVVAAETDTNKSVDKTEQITIGEEDSVPYLEQTSLTMYKGTYYILNIQNQLPEAVVTFISSDNTVVEVDSTGRLIAREMGQATVTAQVQQGSQMYELNINIVIYANSSTTMLLDTTQASLKIGEKILLPLHLFPNDATDLVSYTSDNLVVAAVDEYGLITALRQGTAVITASLSNGQTVEWVLDVTSELQSIQVLYIADNKCTLAVGQNRTFQNLLLPDNVSDTKLIWASDNEKIATVNQQGKVTAKKVGKVQISIEADDGSGIKAVIIVNVKKRDRVAKSTETRLSIVNDKKALYSYKEMVKDLKQLKKSYGDCININVLAVTYDNRNIYEVVLGNPDAKKKIVIQSAIHGREYMTTLLTMKQIEFYCSNYYSGMYQKQYYSELFEDVALYIVPMVNPDGVTISQYGAKGIKDSNLKTKIQTMCKRYGKGRASYYTLWKANARGVDINRNFNTYWNLLKNGVRRPAALFYKGKTAESEIETKALVNLINLVEPICTISYHASGSVLYWDYGQKGTMKKKVYHLVDTIHDLTKYEIKSGFHKKNSAGFSDWISIKKKIPAVTIEIGKKSCPLKISKFKSIWKENKMIYALVAEMYQ